MSLSSFASCLSAIEKENILNQKVLGCAGYLYVKSDVYCFGVFLLEMLTGLRALDYKRPSGQRWLVDWVKPMLSEEGKLKSIMDVKMEGQYSSEAELQAAQLTLRCLESRPENRPSMEQVLENLKEIEAM